MAKSTGYSSSLVVRYVASGWLVSPARGVYMRKGGFLKWEGVVWTLQCMEDLSLHVGGRLPLGGTAINLFEHDLPILSVDIDLT